MTLAVILFAAMALLLLLVIAGADLVFLEQKSHLLGERLRVLSGRYTLYSTSIAGVLGALLAHFFWP